MRKLIMTVAAGLLLTLTGVSVDAAARKAATKPTEGRAAYEVPVPPILYRFNDFGPEVVPFAVKTG
jgi:hypothetical protein